MFSVFSWSAGTFYGYCKDPCGSVAAALLRFSCATCGGSRVILDTVHFKFCPGSKFFSAPCTPDKFFSASKPGWATPLNLPLILCRGFFGLGSTYGGGACHCPTPKRAPGPQGLSTVMLCFCFKRPSYTKLFRLDWDWIFLMSFFSQFFTDFTIIV